MNIEQLPAYVEVSESLKVLSRVLAALPGATADGMECLDGRGDDAADAKRAADLLIERLLPDAAAPHMNLSLDDLRARGWRSDDHGEVPDQLHFVNELLEGETDEYYAIRYVDFCRLRGWEYRVVEAGVGALGEGDDGGDTRPAQFKAWLPPLQPHEAILVKWLNDYEGYAVIVWEAAGPQVKGQANGE